jgi:Flp pilus assembly protein TadG
MRALRREPAQRSWHRRRRHADPDAERGSGTAETVIIMTVLALIIFGMVQYAADIHGQQAAQTAASLALATAREQDGTAAAAHAAAAAELAQLTSAIHDPVIDVERTPTQVTVTITGAVTTLFGVTEHVTVTDAGPVDRFEPNTGSGS